MSPPQRGSPWPPWPRHPFHPRITQTLLKFFVIVPQYLDGLFLRATFTVNKRNSRCTHKLYYFCHRFSVKIDSMASFFTLDENLDRPCDFRVILCDQMQDPPAYNSSARTHVIVKSLALLAREASPPPSPQVSCRWGLCTLDAEAGLCLMALSYLWSCLLCTLPTWLCPPE